MAKRKTSSRKRKSSAQKKAEFVATVIIAVILFFMQQQGKPLSKTGPVEEDQVFEDVSIASVYDGDTFKINLNYLRSTAKKCLCVCAAWILRK